MTLCSVKAPFSTQSCEAWTWSDLVAKEFNQNCFLRWHEQTSIHIQNSAKRQLNKLVFKDLEAGGAKFPQLKNPHLPLTRNMRISKDAITTILPSCTITLYLWIWFVKLNSDGRVLIWLGSLFNNIYILISTRYFYMFLINGPLQIYKGKKNHYLIKVAVGLDSVSYKCEHSLSSLFLHWWCHNVSVCSECFAHCQALTTSYIGKIVHLYINNLVPFSLSLGSNQSW